MGLWSLRLKSYKLKKKKVLIQVYFFGYRRGLEFIRDVKFKISGYIWHRAYSSLKLIPQQFFLMYKSPKLNLNKKFSLQTFFFNFFRNRPSYFDKNLWALLLMFVVMWQVSLYLIYSWYLKSFSCCINALIWIWKSV